ncbi:DUF4145 domain-containing protein [Pseudomonas sp. PGPR40]|uniref:DUF4145 domain-containing protein n=1 Tax=Pseudomonas sp. PGPR40 TaxID=2913476 RepID=UPI001EDC7670|nr:DUF4145 domain-containing protein [Pseudomonas sp. PGPR40]
MSELVEDCPRCHSKSITFDVKSDNLISIHHNWQKYFELFCICRACKKSTTFMALQKNIESTHILQNNTPFQSPEVLNRIFLVKGFVSSKDAASKAPPEYLPDNVEAAFIEGSSCMAIGCYNAGATMFRLCLDLSTRAMLPETDEAGLNNKIRRNLGFRLPWLFDNGRLPEALRDLSSCVKDDGNDGAHEGTLSEADAQDLSEFAFIMLERIYTEPKRIEIAKLRRQERHQ